MVRMDEKQVISRKQYNFPRVVIIIIVFQYFLKFSYSTLRGILPLYFVDVLSYEENKATVFFHLFYMFLFTFSLIGGIIADSYLGKFRSVVIFGFIFAIGLLLLSVTSVPSLHLPTQAFSIFGLVVAALGFGAVKPCVISFGGNQFLLPDQEKQLSMLFILITVVNNAGSTTAFFISPVLRKDVTCFGQLTCYSLTFLIPVILVSLMTAVILFTKNMYRIEKPESNIVMIVFKCVVYALYRKLTYKEKREHWLDYADDRYNSSLIEDIKSIAKLLKLLLPFPIFWALYNAQSSTWIFQASRMNGEVGSYVIKPDQMQIGNPIFVILLVPMFQSYIYPFLAKFFVVNTPLRRITLGCLVMALAYYASAALEFNLEYTYAKTPVKGFAQLRIYNTLDCSVNMTIGEQKISIDKLDMWQNISISTEGHKFLEYEANLDDCDMKQPSKNLKGTLEVKENKAISWAVTKNGLDYKFADHVDKSMSGNPLIRTLIFIDDDFAQNSSSLSIVKNQKALEYIAVPKKMSESQYREINHGIYDLYVDNRLVEANVPLKSGGVYTIVGHISKLSTTVRTVTVTEPNSLHIMWILPQQFLLSTSEVLVDITGMDFVYSQAPPSMKSFLQAFWLYLGFFGNLIVIIVTKAQFFDRKMFEFLLYAVMMTIGTLIFGILANNYQYIKVSGK